MSNDQYFSERTKGVAPATESTLSHNFWRGLVVAVDRLIASAHLAEAFPTSCPDGSVNAGVHGVNLGNALRAEIPNLGWPLDAEQPPTEDLDILDMIEFLARRVSKPTSTSHHGYFQHDHYFEFDRTQGIAEFSADVNRLLRRNKHPYELLGNGSIRYALSPGATDLIRVRLETPDAELNRLLEKARAKILDKDFDVRRESLEALWDAWERLKTVLDADKKRGAELLLQKATQDAEYRELLAAEARTLTAVGNEFRIRHSETDKHPITEVSQVEYLHHRMYALIVALARGIAPHGS